MRDPSSRELFIRRWRVLGFAAVYFRLAVFEEWIVITLGVVARHNMAHAGARLRAALAHDAFSWVRGNAVFIGEERNCRSADGNNCGPYKTGGARHAAHLRSLLCKVGKLAFNAAERVEVFAMPTVVVLGVLLESPYERFG